MVTEDKTINCADCGTDFILSASEQEFFKARGLHEPKRCKKCRDLKRSEQRR